MAIYEVTLPLTAYVVTDTDNEHAVAELARDKIAAGPCLCVIEGLHRKAGHYLVKGMSAGPATVRPFVGNRRVQVKGGKNAAD
jgi:hypothetical protein